VLEGASRAPMLGQAAPAGVHQQVRVDGDHGWRRSHACICSRFATSRPGASAPFSVTQRIRGRA
jgi:hypothetical protein